MNRRSVILLLTIVLFVVLLIGMGILFGPVIHQSIPYPKNSQALTPVTPSVSLPPYTPSPPTPTSTVIGSTSTSLLDQLPIWTPSIQWETSQPDTWRYISPNGENTQMVPGFSRSSLPSDIGLPTYWEAINRQLGSMGWSDNPYLTGEGPSGVIWGYEKMENGKKRIFAFRSHIQGCGDVRTTPCYKEKVFYSNPF